MTTYRQRHLDGHHTAEGQENTNLPPGQGDDDNGHGNGPTLKELRDQADQLGIPSYGKKADIAQRIADHQAEA